MSLTIVEIKTSVQNMLSAAYSATESAKKVTDFMQIETAGFMRKKDAESIAKCCQSNKIQVSFRVAGADTILRIAQQHPCKGHDIMDKSIKKTGGNWTYLIPTAPILGKTGEQAMESIKGFVGSPFKPLKEDGTIDFDSPDRAPQTTQNEKGEVIKTTFFLDGVYMLEETVDKGVVTGIGYSKMSLDGINAGNIARAYTGDYDMHDLIVKGARPLATTPEENSAIDLLNIAMLNNSKERMAKAAKLQGFKEKKIRYKNSPYALIRHGAQTSFLDFLLSDTERASFKGTMQDIGTSTKLPYQGSVIKIDDNIVAFNAKGEAFILNGVGQIYKYYKDNGLLNQIPFYNFFASLKEIGSNRPLIESYALYLNSIFRSNLGLIAHK